MVCTTTQKCTPTSLKLQKVYNIAEDDYVKGYMSPDVYSEFVEKSSYRAIVPVEGAIPTNEVQLTSDRTEQSGLLNKVLNKKS